MWTTTLLLGWLTLAEDAAPAPEVLSARLDAFAETCQARRGIAASAFRKHLRAPDRGRRGWLVVLVGRDADERLAHAAVVARAADAELRVVLPSALVGKHHGETEANLDAVLAAATKDGVVLFFDEADALFGKRTEVKDAHDRYANQEVSYLRARLLAHPDLVVAGVRVPAEPAPEAPVVDVTLAIGKDQAAVRGRPWTQLCWPPR